jgi:hypothetical protein
MPLMGNASMILGIGLALWGIFMDPSTGYGSGYGDAGRLANLHMLNIKTALVIMGGALVVAGSVLFGSGQVVNSLRR